MKTVQNFKIKISVRFSSYVAGLVLVIALYYPCLAQNDGGIGNDETAANFAAFEESNLKLIPVPLLKIDPVHSQFVLIADKSTQKLSLYKFDGKYHKVKTYECTTGSIKGDKGENGDLKTPEGVYFLTDLWDYKELNRQYGKAEAAQYGMGAFNMNYPNEVDKIRNKKGYGIWLHATNSPERIRQPYDTKGCIVISDNDLKELTSVISLNKTPIIVVKETKYYSSGEQEPEFEKVSQFIDRWKTSWEHRKFEVYRASYSSEFKSDNKTLSEWLDYKKLVLKGYKEISISLSDMRIYRSDDYYLAEFHQVYHADDYRDVGTKRLYIIESEGNYEIIAEKWKAAQDKSEKQ